MLHAQRVVSEVTDAMVNRKAINVATTAPPIKPVSRNMTFSHAPSHQPQLIIREDSEQMQAFPQSPPIILSHRTKANTNSKRSLQPEDIFKGTFLQRANDTYEIKNPVIVQRSKTNFLQTPSRPEPSTTNKENLGDSNTPFFANNRKMSSPMAPQPPPSLKTNCKQGPTHHRVQTQRSFPIQPSFVKPTFQGRSMSIANETQASLTDMSKGPVKVTTRIDLSLVDKFQQAGFVLPRNDQQQITNESQPPTFREEVAKNTLSTQNKSPPKQRVKTLSFQNRPPAAQQHYKPSSQQREVPQNQMAKQWLQPPVQGTGSTGHQKQMSFEVQATSCNTSLLDSNKKSQLQQSPHTRQNFFQHSCPESVSPQSKKSEVKEEEWLLRTAEFPTTKFIVSPPKRCSDVANNDEMPQLTLFNPKQEIAAAAVYSNNYQLPPSVILREQEEEKHKQASQKGSRKRDILPQEKCRNNTNSISNISHTSVETAGPLPVTLFKVNGIQGKATTSFSNKTDQGRRDNRLLFQRPPPVQKANQRSSIMGPLSDKSQQQSQLPQKNRLIVGDKL